MASVACLLRWRLYPSIRVLGKVLGFAVCGRRWVILAVPILIQVVFNADLAYRLNKKLGVVHFVVGPSALIGTSNFLNWRVPTRQRCRTCNQPPDLVAIEKPQTEKSS